MQSFILCFSAFSVVLNTSTQEERYRAEGVGGFQFADAHGRQDLNAEDRTMTLTLISAFKILARLHPWHLQF